MVTPSYGYASSIFNVGGVLVRIADWSQHRKWEGRLGLSEGALLLD